MSIYFDKFLSDKQRGFKTGFCTQHFLLNLLVKCKNSVDKGKSFGALLSDFSKEFDCLDHELLTVKLNAYRSILPELRLIHDYLLNRRQRTKIDHNYSSWSEILFDVPQASILGPLFKNIFLTDLFCVVKEKDIASYADGRTPFIVENSIDSVIEFLGKVSDALFNWFKNNLLKMLINAMY